MIKGTAAVITGVGLLTSSIALAGERTVALDVQNMYCTACPFIVQKALEAVPGVAKVVVSYSRKTAVVTFDNARTAVPALLAATTKAGLPVHPKKLSQLAAN